MNFWTKSSGDSSFGTLTVATNLNEYRTKSLKNNHVLLANNTETGTTVLPFVGFNWDTTEDQQKEITTRTVDFINGLDATSHFYIESALLDGIPVNYRIDIAKALFNKTNFEDITIRNVNKRTDKMGEALRRIELGVSSLPSYSTINTNENGFLQLNKKGFLKQAVEGDMFYVQDGNYLFVKAVLEDSLEVLQFNSDVFNSIEETNLTTDQFLMLYNKIMNC